MVAEKFNEAGCEVLLGCCIWASSEFDHGPGHLRVGDREFLPRMIRRQASVYPADLFAHHRKTVDLLRAQVSKATEDVVPIRAAGVVIRQPTAAQGLPPEDTRRAAAALGLTPHTLWVSIAGNGLSDHAAEAGRSQGTAHFRLRGERERILDKDRLTQDGPKEALSHPQCAGMDAAVVVDAQLRPVQGKVQRPNLDFTQKLGEVKKTG